MLPNGGNYFTLDVDGKVTQWRVPFPLHLARLHKELSAHNLMGFGMATRAEVAAVQNAAQSGETLEMLEQPESMDKAIAVWSLGGAAIGLCWYGRDFDLDVDFREQGHDLYRYGEMVLEELHDAGWSMSAISGVYSELFVRSLRSMRPASEVAERVDFSEAPKGAISS